MCERETERKTQQLKGVVGQVLSLGVHRQRFTLSRLRILTLQEAEQEMNSQHLPRYLDGLAAKSMPRASFTLANSHFLSFARGW